VDSKIQGASSNAVLRLTPGPHRLDFRFGPATRSDSFRMQFKLDGLDKDWREIPGAMRLTVRFHNADGDVLQNVDFEARGNSEGWTKTPAHWIGLWACQPMRRPS
jgi:hypothetical protein